MLNVNKFVYGKLKNDAPLKALVGASVFDVRPEIITVFPGVYYHEGNQTDAEFVDDQPQASNSVIVVDVYAKTSGAKTVTEIAIAVANVFKGIFWACVYNQEIPDPAPDVRHRVMQFTRPLLASDVS